MAALKGTIFVDTAAQASGKTNTLDYGNFSGAVVVDYQNGIATGIGTGTALTQLTAVSEVQRLTPSGASGSFRLGSRRLAHRRDSNQRQCVDYRGQHAAGALNNMLGAGSVTVSVPGLGT